MKRRGRDEASARSANPGCKTWPATTLGYAGRYGSWAPKYCRDHRPCRSGDRHPFAHEPRFFSDIHSSEHRSIEYYFIVGSHGVLNMVLGLSLPTPAAYILLAMLVGPALTQAGMVPIAAHLFIFALSQTRCWSVTGLK